MTSSLVGSEMCIRDRSSDSVRCSYRRTCTSTRVVPGSRPVTVQVAVAGTVSYTHLTLPTICSV
eukprot:12549082-Prorocentrum_lima.AAC.1